MNRRLLLLCSVAAVLAIVLLVDRGVAPPPVEPVVQVSKVETPAAEPETDGQAMLNPLEGMVPEGFTAMLERPLFNPTRTARAPDTPASPPLPAVSEAPPPVGLQGPRAEDFKLVAISAGSTGRVAAVRVVATGEVLYLREGQPVQTWTVLAVEDRSVVIGTAGSSIELTLFPGVAGGEPPEAAPPPPPAEPVIESDPYHSYSEDMPDSGGMQ